MLLGGYKSFIVLVSPGLSRVFGLLLFLLRHHPASVFQKRDCTSIRLRTVVVSVSISVFLSAGGSYPGWFRYPWWQPGAIGLLSHYRSGPVFSSMQIIDFQRLFRLFATFS